MIQNPNTIRAEGYRVLSRELGAANAANFLRQLENGNGDYTQERHTVLEENTIDAITERIKTRKEQRD
jgi:beta-lactamase class D